MALMNAKVIDLSQLPDNEKIYFKWGENTEQMIIATHYQGTTITLGRDVKLTGVPIECERLEKDHSHKWRMTDTTGNQWIWERCQGLPESATPLLPGQVSRMQVYIQRCGAPEDPTAPAYDLILKNDSNPPYQRWIEAYGTPH